MKKFSIVSKGVLDEIPLNKLPGYIKSLKFKEEAYAGMICGNGCENDGCWCGFECPLPDKSQFVIDPEGRLGLNRADLEGIRKNFGQFQKTLAADISKSGTFISKMKVH
jgi:hypothetical protein